ncbi:hypothetical protein [Crucian carp herpesvirus]|uniref:ORF37 n=1 Tax=Cyprinid herpesvirus 2 TaxID=317878 RepID=A0A109QM35_CYHV2|nr:ORF37 [Cyprinid herpesvirus 2]APB92891.1 hypothetical protein [Crucian carp herpesvirus]
MSETSAPSHHHNTAIETNAALISGITIALLVVVILYVTSMCKRVRDLQRRRAEDVARFVTPPSFNRFPGFVSPNATEMIIIERRRDAPTPAAPTADSTPISDDPVAAPAPISTDSDDESDAHQPSKTVTFSNVCEISVIDCTEPEIDDTLVSESL